MNVVRAVLLELISKNQRNLNPYLKSIAKEKARARQSPNDAGSGSTPVKRDNEYDVITAVQPSQTNSIAVDEDGTDFSYFSALSFGSAGKTMYMLIDTGAANTWVMGANCASDACEKHNTLGEQDSKTLEATGSTFNLTYGTGSISGVTVNDTVEIAVRNLRFRCSLRGRRSLLTFFKVFSKVAME